MLAVPIAYVQPGTTLARPLYSSRGDLLLNQGVELQAFMIDYLREAGFSTVCVRDRETEDIEIRETISGRVHAQATASVSRIFDTIEAAAADIPKNITDIRAA
ncbi:MAG: hypothetical protein KGJ86_04465, partial [Chloroflexota bacterium]|nr:hypothetical protein [Chloroflexota bacterium]